MISLTPMNSLTLSQHDSGWTSATEQPVNWETHQKDGSPPFTPLKHFCRLDAEGCSRAGDARAGCSPL